MRVIEMSEKFGHLGRTLGKPEMRLNFGSLVLLFVAAALQLSFLGCSPSSQVGANQEQSSSDRLELTDDLIRKRINDARVWDIPDETEVGEPISWGFDEDEPKEIVIVEKQIEPEKATIVLDIKTMSSPRSREPRYLAGQIKTKWELQSGWVIRRWRIVETENISMKYKKLPKAPVDAPSPQIGQ